MGSVVWCSYLIQVVNAEFSFATLPVHLGTVWLLPWWERKLPESSQRPLGALSLVSVSQFIQSLTLSPFLLSPLKLLFVCEPATFTRSHSVLWALFLVFLGPFLVFLCPSEPLCDTDWLLPDRQLWGGIREGCRSIVGNTNSRWGDLRLSCGLAVLSHLFPSVWELWSSFAGSWTHFPSTSTALLRNRRGQFSFWSKTTLKIYGMKLELLLCFSINGIFFFLFILVHFGAGGSVKWYSNHHIFWKTWHSLRSTMLCDYKYTLAQPVWHTLIGKGFQWPYSLKWPINVSSTLLDMFLKEWNSNKLKIQFQAAKKRTIAPPLVPSGSVYVKLPQVLMGSAL